jgi:hypothetical protein
MATGIFPESSAGGLVIRDAAGNPTGVQNVNNAYVPSAAFLSTCLLTALPSDCTARIEARQINAIVSELVSFAECMDFNGPWDCNALNNLCQAFNTWVYINIVPTIISDTRPPAPKHNQFWWESDTGLLFIWYDDGNSQQWVQVTPGPVVVDGVSIVGGGVKTDPLRVGLVDCGTY